MDFFGIGAAIAGAARIYFQSARRTGRTMSMLNSLKDGDRVVFADIRECERVRKLFMGAGKNVDCIVVNPSRPSALSHHAIPQGVLVFDHSWVEVFYKERISSCMKEIDYLQSNFGGLGQEYIETGLKAAELAKWHL